MSKRKVGEGGELMGGYPPPLDALARTLPSAHNLSPSPNPQPIALALLLLALALPSGPRVRSRAESRAKGYGQRVGLIQSLTPNPQHFPGGYGEEKEGCP